MAKEKSRRPAELSLRTISKLWRLMEVAAMSYKLYRQILTFSYLSKKARPPPGTFPPLDMNYQII